MYTVYRLHICTIDIATEASKPHNGRFDDAQYPISRAFFGLFAYTYFRFAMIFFVPRFIARKVFLLRITHKNTNIARINQRNGRAQEYI